MKEFEIQEGVLKKYFGENKIVVIPDGVLRIGRNAFSNTPVREVVVPEGVVTIESYAFACANELRKIVLPLSLKEIGLRAFGDCKHLATDYLQIGDYVKVDSRAFQGCCRRKYESHVFEVQYTVYHESRKASIELDMYDDESVESVVDSNINDFIRDAFQEFIDDAVGHGGASMNSKGVYDITAVTERIYSAAVSYVDDHADEVSLYIVDDYTIPDKRQIIEIDVVEKIKVAIEERQTCETREVDVSGAISGDVIDFQVSGFWRYGLRSSYRILCNVNEWPLPKRREKTVEWVSDNEVLVPVLWFGRAEDRPMQRWMITPFISKEDFRLWFLETKEDIMDSVVEDFDSIGIWYLYECGMDVPDLAEIVKSCPVHFEKNDDADTINEKITSFFLQKKTLGGEEEADDNC